MLFSSYSFIFVFLPIAFFGYYWLARNLKGPYCKFFLVIASLIFYAQWNEIYLLLITGSIIFNFMVGDWLLRQTTSAKTPQLKINLTFALGVVFNLGLLGYFKYFDFFVININALTGSDIPVRNILLPLAISFFTFQQIAFLTERYRGIKENYSFLDYSLFVVFFPQLIAGPIIHPKDTLGQFADPRSAILNQKNILFGLILFSIGVFKKVVIADSFVATVAGGFDAGITDISAVMAWLVALAYTFQLYFDFSGYTDMALGLGLLFNIRLPINFNSPYKACDIQDFWRRWHITLSNFLRDHLYIPLGGNRKGVSVTYFNLFMTFLLGGLWHGAGWTFVIWGAMHGGALCIHRFWSSTGMKLPDPLAWLLTMLFVISAWVFFRAPDVATAWTIILAMYDINGIYASILTSLSSGLPSLAELITIESSELLVKIILCASICLLLKNSNQFVFGKMEASGSVLMKWHLLVIAGMLVSGVLTISLQEYTEFIYFNF